MRYWFKQLMLDYDSSKVSAWKVANIGDKVRVLVPSLE